MDDKTFSMFVSDALDSIPREFKDKMENVDIVISDYADEETLKSVNINSPMNLLGIYQGVPQTKRGQYGIGMSLPDKITLYKYPILSRARTINEVKFIVQDTVIHEIAHHFGISDSEIEKIKNKTQK